MKKEFKKVLEIFEKYDLKSIKAELLFDEDIHNFYSYYSEKIKENTEISERKLNQKELEILKLSCIMRAFFHNIDLNFKIMELEHNEKMWLVDYPFYHLLFKPNSSLGMHFVLDYTIGRNLIEKEGFDEIYESFQMLLNQKINSFEVLLAYLDERELLNGLRADMINNPNLIPIMAKYVKSRVVKG